jgi:hypothetical protein
VITAIYSGDSNDAGSSTTTAFTETVKSVHDGDLNGDGVVNAADVMLAERIVQGLLVPTSTQLTHGDIDGDGTINVADVEHILRKALGLESF